MSKDAKSQYEELKRKHSLPDFDSIDTEFQIRTLDEEVTLSEIRRKLHEKIEDSLEFLSPVLAPDTNLNDMYEGRIISEAEKHEVFETYKRLMFWRRSSFIAYMNNGESDAEFIKEFFAEWKDLKKVVVSVAEKLRDSWTKDLEQPEKLGYFG